MPYIRRYFPPNQEPHRIEQTHVISALLLDVCLNLWAAPNRTEAEGRLNRLIETLRPRYARLATWLEETAHETLAFLALPEEHRKRLRTTNGMEHDHMQVRRRTRVIRIFPNEESLLRLVTALAVERNEQWCEKKYVTFASAKGQENVTQPA